MLARNSEPSKEMQSILSEDPPSLLKVLECGDLGREFRQRSQKLMDYLLKEETLIELITLLMETESRDLHNKVCELLKTQNDQLQRVVSYNRNVAAKILETLDPVIQDDGKIDEVATTRRLFAACTFQRLIERALDNWPQFIDEVFQVGENPLYKKVVMHIDMLVVRHTISDKVSQAGVYELMWHIWRRLVMEVKPMDVAEKDRPLFVFLRKDLRFDESDGEFGQKHQESAVELLQKFFASNPRDAPIPKEFSNLVMNWIASLDVKTLERLPGLFAVAAAIGYNETMWKLALDVVLNEQDSTSCLTAYGNAALSYVVACSKVQETEEEKPEQSKNKEFLRVIEKILLKEKFDQQRANRLVEMIGNLGDCGYWDEDEFRQDLKKTVTEAYARTEDKVWRRAVCVEIAAHRVQGLFGEEEKPIGALAALLNDQDLCPSWQGSGFDQESAHKMKENRIIEDYDGFCDPPGLVSDDQGTQPELVDPQPNDGQNVEPEPVDPQPNDDQNVEPELPSQQANDVQDVEPEPSSQQANDVQSPPEEVTAQE